MDEGSNCTNSWVYEHVQDTLVRRIHKHQIANAVEKPKLQEKLLRQLRSLAKSFRLDYRILSLEFLDVLPAVATLYDEALEATEISQPASGGDHTWFDNRPVWSRLLDKSFLDHVFQDVLWPSLFSPSFLGYGCLFLMESRKLNVIWV